jgi:hypothetical protein
MHRAIAMCAACAVLAGCVTYSNVADPERDEQVTGIDKHGTYPAVRRENFERVNILELVDPERQAEVKFEKAWKGAEQQRDSAGKYGVWYDLAFATFRERSDISDAEKRRRRNSIQERILSVAISRCNVFKTYLRRDQADTNFWLGTATTAAGILGAVLPGATASRNLSGAAGLFSGIRSEYNQAYYSNLAAHVIVKAIETRQEIVYRRIQNEGQQKSLTHYPLEAAIKDAIYFDGLCSVVNGLDQAATSVDATLEPGLDAATRTLLRARLAREALDLPKEKLLEPETLERFGLAGSRLGMSLVGSARGPSVAEDEGVDLVESAQDLAARLKGSVDQIAENLEQASVQRRAALVEELTKTEPKQAEDVGKAAPNEGAVADAVRAELKKKLFEGLKLDQCFGKEAETAMQGKVAAAKAQNDAKAESEKVAAGYRMKAADRAIQAVHDGLQRKRELVALDLESYRKQRLDAIGQMKVNSINDPAQIAGSLELTASKGEGCAVAQN